MLHSSKTAENNFHSKKCLKMNAHSAREYTMFAPAQILRNWFEQRPSNEGDLDSIVRGSLRESIRRRWTYFWSVIVVGLRIKCSSLCMSVFVSAMLPCASTLYPDNDQWSCSLRGHWNLWLINRMALLHSKMICWKNSSFLCLTADILVGIKKPCLLLMESSRRHKDS
jgi:hypothetical protein